ncbi:MAG: hypothetical protein PHU88_10885 [candidate division Zixibacteria bacterium]|nr:hypothetical protein [candidate division Zixibacteria bacterium]MDD5426003.1 hypothetical protein [candidate division Zixibacteria bacterium]
MTRKIPQIICALFGMTLFLLYFSQHPTARNLNLTILNDYFQIIFAFTLLVGVVSFVKVNLKAFERGEDRSYHLVSVIGVFIMPLLAIIWGIKGDSPFMWVFENIQVPMQATVFALLAFFVASASFRGFRARSVQATILLAAALIMLLSRSTIGDMIADQIPQIADWIRNYPSMAARRAILIGIGLGSLTTSLRVMVGIERTWLGGDK